MKSTLCVYAKGAFQIWQRRAGEKKSSSAQLFEGILTTGAHVLSVEDDQAFGMVTEYAARLVFLQDNAIPVHKNFQLIPIVDGQALADALRIYKLERIP